MGFVSKSRHASILFSTAFFPGRLALENESEEATEVDADLLADGCFGFKHCGVCTGLLDLSQANPQQP